MQIVEFELDRDPVALGPPIDLGPDCRGPRA